MNLIESAKNYLKLNYSVIPTDNTKRSLFAWKKYQNEKIKEEEIETMFSHKKCQGIAVICGKVSENLEVIDVDCKNGVSFKDYAQEIRKVSEELYNKLTVIETKSGGYHIYFRCDYIEGNQKLAKRYANEDELKENPNIKELVLIETRGEGGYVIAPPTKGYNLVQNRITPVITKEEREIIMNCARSFNNVYDEVKYDTSSDDIGFQLKPYEDYNQRADISELLQNHGWTIVETKGERVFYRRPGATSHTSANYHTGKKIFYVFSTSSQFENKGYTPFAVFALLECNNDFKLATRKVVEMGYGEKKKIVDKPIVNKINLMLEQSIGKDDILDELIRSFKFSREEANSIFNTVSDDNENKFETFWSVTYNQFNRARVVIQKYKLEKFLSDNNYGLYFHEAGSRNYRLIYDDNGFIEEVNSENIKKFIKSYIKSLPPYFDKKGTTKGITGDDLLEVIYKGADTYFSNSFFEFIEHKQLDLLKDTPDKCHFSFKNGVVVIDKSNVKLLSYGQVKKHIWKSQVNSEHEISIDQDYDPQLCEYYRFLEKISGDDFNRLTYAMTLIGYILHSYKDPSKPYAPIMAEETDDENLGGGTGKGIFFKAISYMIPTVRIDGKNFKPDKPFAFQRVDLGTKLVVIEDCPKNVDFEKYYPTITEGMTIEKKNKDELFLNFSESPKISFTTNYSINNNAEHAKRRQKVFEFAPFFSSAYTPMDFFGHKLFDSWDSDEWNRFYNFMFFCVSIYLEKGILEVHNSEKLKRKNIKQNFGEDFLEYIEDLISKHAGNHYTLSDEWKSFLLRFEMDKKDYSMKRFRKALQVTLPALNVDFEFFTSKTTGYVKMFKFRNFNKQNQTEQL